MLFASTPRPEGAFGDVRLFAAALELPVSGFPFSVEILYSKTGNA
jgi:hypothetical protein